jgi:hypothetical protein
VDDGISLGELAIELLSCCHDDLKIGKLLFQSLHVRIGQGHPD